VKPGQLAHAYYDVGILQFLKGDYDSALTNLSQASQLDSSKVILDAVADCRVAKESAATLAHHTTDASGAIADAGGLQQTSVKTEKSGTAEDRLRKLEDLLKKKLITREEY